MPDNTKIKLLKIESQRAQTFLFKVPRLADMDGANALLGDLFRRKLPCALTDYLVPPPKLDEAKGHLPDEKSAAPGDSISCASALPQNAGMLTGADIPAEAFRRGILVRDGGRFWGLVTEKDIEAAKAAAAATIQAHCPGLGYAFHVGDLDNEDAPADTPSESATDLVALPCFRWSEDGGDEPASEEILIGEDKRFVARSSIKKRKARERSVQGTGSAALWDIASILRSTKAIPVSDTEPNKVDFTKIAAGRYLAVIHMDGNGIGKRSMNAGKINENDFIFRQAKMEAFFFGMRSSMRAAVAAALNEHFKKTPDHYRLLMLGGDDVLMVCRADKALPLVKSVARSLSDHKLADGQPLTMGAGIAMGKPKLPFHRLHELAEQLASSAKRIAIDPNGKRRSVVDWQISTSSWVDSIDHHRARWERIRYATDPGTETLLLTGKPYPILESSEPDKSQDPPEPSLEALLNFCEALRQKFYGDDPEKQGIRSQLKHFLGELRKGKVYAELAWAELPDNVRKHFKDHSPTGFAPPDSNGEQLWQQLNDSIYRCWVADAIELVELQQIGRREKEEKDRGDSPATDREEAA